MDDSTVIGVVVRVLGAVTAVLGAANAFLGNKFFSDYFATRKEHAKRLQIMELASKRVEFWVQFLDAQSKATEDGSPERKQAQQLVSQALAQVKQDADLQLQLLSYNEQLRRVAMGKPHHLQKPASPSSTQRANYYLGKFGFLLFLLYASFFGWLFFRFLLKPKPAPILTPISNLPLKLILTGVLFFCGIFASLSVAFRSRRSAVLSQYPKSDAPLLDQI